MGITYKANEEALNYFKHLNDTLLLAVRYTDQNGVWIIPINPNMPIFNETTSHFCVNGIVLDFKLYTQYRSMLILQLLEEHPYLIDIYPTVLPESRSIVKISKILRLKSREKIHENCCDLRKTLCPDFEKELKHFVIETNGNKLLENKIDLYVFPVYYTNDSFSGITKEFSDQYLSVYRKIKALLDRTPQKKDLIGKCLISNAVETGKYIATLFCDANLDDDVYDHMIGKLKEYVVSHKLSIGFPIQVKTSGDMARQKERTEHISGIFKPHCIYILN